MTGEVAERSDADLLLRGHWRKKCSTLIPMSTAAAARLYDEIDVHLSFGVCACQWLNGTRGMCQADCWANDQFLSISFGTICSLFFFSHSAMIKLKLRPSFSHFHQE